MGPETDRCAGADLPVGCLPDGGGGAALPDGTDHLLGAGMQRLHLGHRVTPVLESLAVNHPISLDTHLQPFGVTVGGLDADPVQTARSRQVPAPAALKLAPRVQLGQCQGQGRLVLVRHYLHRNAPAVVLNGHGTVLVQGDHDAIADAGHSFVHGIVHHLQQDVVQAVSGAVAYVHAGQAAHRLQALELGDIVGGVGCRFGRHGYPSFASSWQRSRLSPPGPTRGPGRESLSAAVAIRGP